MSEYQYVEFRAVDKPLDDAALEFMRRQSTRAEITRWSFVNEYHFGDFHGNAREMMRRGFDVHLHYANFGIRHLLFRLPWGLPVTGAQRRAYLTSDGLRWHADPRGRGGVLEIAPQLDAGSLNELWGLADWMEQLLPVRQALVDGDPRPLYAAWLGGAVGLDDDPAELSLPPLPAGLDPDHEAVAPLLEFYELSPDLLTAAALIAPAAAAGHQTAGRQHGPQQIRTWLRRQKKPQLVELCLELLSEDATPTRGKTLRAIHQSQPAAAWPLLADTRTLADLHDAAQAISQQREEREQRSAAAGRRRRLKNLARNPQRTLQKVAGLIALQAVDSYQEAAALLADLREALGADAGPVVVAQYVAGLRRKYPRKQHLLAALRRAGLLDS